MKRETAHIIAPYLFLLFSWGCAAQDHTLTLRTSGTGHPVEGALVFSPGERTVHRSNVRGVVTLPAGYGEAGLTIHAKNHRPLEIALSEASGDVLMVFDEALVNPGEARMVFDRADTLRGSYGPFRE
ncbi:hypothetical protein ACGF5M_06600, partial [Gemmatimonadota bacterium]